jgi:hypothetical protein
MKSLMQTIAVLTVLNFALPEIAWAQAPAAPPEPAAVAAPASSGEVRAAQDEAQKSQEQVRAAQEQMRVVAASVNTERAAYKSLDQQLYDIRQSVSVSGTFPRAGDRVLVIPASQMQAQDLARIRQDMTVMARIIDTQAGSASGGPTGVGATTWAYLEPWGQSSRAAQTMYLEGYGALFLRRVDFPLSPPPALQQEQNQTKQENADQVWEQTRRDIYEPGDGRRRKTDTSAQKYDAEKVENLKTNLVKALKHAANIRNLKADESVVVVVTGSAVPSKYTVVGEMGPNKYVLHDKEKDVVTVYEEALPSELAGGGPTILIMRAKKVDIDAFAKGSLEFDQFRQRVQMFTTQGGSDSVESPSRSLGTVLEDRR